MSTHRIVPRLLLGLLLASPLLPARADGQAERTPSTGLVSREELLAARLRAAGMTSRDQFPRRPVSAADSLAWERARAAASRATGRRIVISLFDRRLWLIDGADTLLSAPAGIGRGKVTYPDGRTADFSTPRGRRVVRAKEKDPVWIPPDWHFAEVANNGQMKLAHLRRGEPVPLLDGSRMVVRGDVVGRLHPDGRFEPFPEGQIISAAGTLFIPPPGTVNRRFKGDLGKFKLDLGDGYLIHGSLSRESIGLSSTHGCIRLGDEALEALFRDTPVGTPVYVY